MRNAKQFRLAEFGIFQNLTAQQLKLLALHEQNLVEAPAVLFLKKGWKISNRAVPGKAEMDVWLISSLIYRKN